MITKIFFLLSLILAPIASFADDTHKEILVSSKMAGACGIMTQLIDFQDITKMEGGNEFVARFWATETARLGVTQEEYFKLCENAVKTYDIMWGYTENK